MVGYECLQFKLTRCEHHFPDRDVCCNQSGNTQHLMASDLILRATTSMSSASGLDRALCKASVSSLL